MILLRLIRFTLVKYIAGMAAVGLLSIMFIPTSVMAVEPDEILDDPVLEERAREISRELRCVTCQSQSIDDSNAPLAKDLRLVVRERVVAGDSNEEVVTYVTERYGDYVRLKPAVRGDTMLLWLTPVLALSGALLVAGIYFRRLKQSDNGSDSDAIEEDADL